MALVCEKKIKIDGEEFLLKIEKTYDYTSSNGVSHYTYWCHLYRETKWLFLTIRKRVYTFEGRSIHYMFYCKNLDNLIEDVIAGYKHSKALNQKVRTHEQTFVSKYEVGGNANEKEV